MIAMAVENMDKFRLKDFNKVQLTEEEVLWAARNAAILLKSVPHSLSTYRNEYVLDLFYRAVTSVPETVKTLEFEEDFYFEDLDKSVSAFFSLLKHYILSVKQVKRKFCRCKKRDKQYIVSGR